MLHKVWLIPISASSWERTEHSSAFDVNLVTDRVPESIACSRAGADDAAAVIRFAGADTLPSTVMPEHWAQCSSTTTTCHGVVIRPQQPGGGRVALAVACSYTRTSSASVNRVCDAAACSFLAAASVAVGKPLSRVFASSSERVSSSSRTPPTGAAFADHNAADVLAFWLASHSLNLRRWASRCARWLQEDPHRLHGGILDAEGLLSDTFVAMSVMELESLPPRPPVTRGGTAATAAARWVLSSAQRRPHHMDPHEERPPAPARSHSGTDGADGVLRSTWQHLMSLSQTFVALPPPRVAQVGPASVAMAAADGAVTSDRTAHGDAMTSRDDAASDVVNMDNVMNNADDVCSAEITDTSDVTRALPRAQVHDAGAAPQRLPSSDWFFQQNIDAPDDVLRGGSDDDKSDADVADVGDGGSGTFTCDGTPPTTSIVPPAVTTIDAARYWPQSHNVPICVAVREHVSLRSRCTATDTFPRGHNVSGALRIEWNAQASEALRHATPPAVAMCGDASDLPLSGFWRLRLEGDESTDLEEEESTPLIALRLCVRVSCGWRAPEGALEMLTRGPQRAEGGGMVADSSSSTDDDVSDEGGDNEGKAWFPGTWSWALKARSTSMEAVSSTQRDVVLILSCTSNYTATAPSLSLACFAVDARHGGGRQLLRMLRLKSPPGRWTSAGFRSAIEVVRQAWMPVDCRGRWVVEQSQTSAEGETPATEVSLLFKGVVALRLPLAAAPISPITCVFHPRIATLPHTRDGGAPPVPTLVAQGRPEFDVLKFKPRSGQGTCGWRDVTQHARPSTGDDNVSQVLLRAPIATRLVYSEPATVHELLTAATGQPHVADPHATLHVRFEGVTASVTGITVDACCMDDQPAEALASSGVEARRVPTIAFLASGNEYMFEFEQGHLVKR